MKNFTLLCALLLMSTTSYAKIGRHNLQINIGGGYQTSDRGEISAFTTYFFGLPLHHPARPAVSLGGGMFTAEVGYLFHSVRENHTVHGFDMRASFSMSFLKGDYDKIYDQNFEKMYGEFAMAYTLGRQLKSGRLMFDILGVGVAFGATDNKYYLNGAPALEGDNDFSFGTYYILPGIQYMTDSGFTIGWRNKAEINTSHFLSIGINTAITIGITLGSGEKKSILK